MARKPLRILIDLIDWPTSGGHPYDWRYKTLCDMGKVLSQHGHKVYCNPCKGVSRKRPPFSLFKDKEPPDVYFCRATVPSKAFRFANRGRVHFICYDHGWLPKSLVMDRQGLFGSSYYRDKICGILNQLPPLPAEAEAFRLHLLRENLTKRPQPKTADKTLSAGYVFIPGQTNYDASIVHSGNTTLIDFLRTVAAWADQNSLPVAYKEHPGLLPSFKQHAASELREVVDGLRLQYTNFNVVNGPIYELMSRARFTACINSGSIIDNLATLTPVYCCGQSFFSQSGAVHYDPHILQGLDTINHMIWGPTRQNRQRELLWWLHENLVQERLTVEENLRRAGLHAGVNLLD
jgi:Capsule polysaccharide biosynthesis protein